ncbi:hypothetical protein FNF29_04254 [Cafeteria roenbergensis]|uniref:Cyclase n=1 Tax=Cafeteria roenbergensis TaxID=33653 RepID=A0A5A8CGD9_CAFRO|nr:hypothetical protein FNF29_04254 [Cafeteria roenbergensis]|eukprot:KAA0151848.1 hypothetical protein FNF29_04254 [Cafeteria roenbergensis]
MGDFVDCSIAVRPAEEKQSRAFGLPNATAAPFTAGSFVCSVSAGASVNCPVLHTCAHSNGTHTEGAAHVLPGQRTLSEAWTPAAAPIVTALLVSVTPRRLGDSSDQYSPGAADDLAITSEAVEEALSALRSAAAGAGSAASSWLAESGERACLGAVCLRTLPNDGAKVGRDWTGSNPAFLTGEAAFLCRALVAPPTGEDSDSTGHLLVDLPSVDREDDGGALIAHRSFFGVTPSGRASALASGPVLPASPEARAAAGAAGAASRDDACSASAPAAPAAAPPAYMPRRAITELCFFSDALSDGLHALNLQCANVELDAAPSRPLLAPLRRVAAAP